MSERPGDDDDALTLLAVGMVAYLAADVTHHVLGHSAACTALGGTILSISPVRVVCSTTGIAVDLAGPAANLAAGLMALCGSLWARSKPVLHLVLVVTAGYNLLWVTGQLVFSALAHRDDWAQFIMTLPPAQHWSLIFAAAGIAAYVAVLRVLSVALRAFANPTPHRLLKVTGFAYLGGALAACLMAVCQPAPIQAIGAAAPQALLLPMGLLFLRPAPSTSPALAVRRRITWVSAALVFTGLSGALFGWATINGR